MNALVEWVLKCFSHKAVLYSILLSFLITVLVNFYYGPFEREIILSSFIVFIVIFLALSFLFREVKNFLDNS